MVKLLLWISTSFIQQPYGQLMDPNDLNIQPEISLQRAAIHLTFATYYPYIELSEPRAT